MYKKISNSNLPKWFKILLYVFFTITMVYLVGWMVYKVLNAIRWIIHNATRPEVWWWTVVITIVAGISVLVIIQTQTDLDPIGNVVRNILDKWQNFRNWLGSIIIGER